MLVHGQRSRIPGTLLAGLLTSALTGCVEPVRVEREWPAMGATANAEVYATTERAALEILDGMQEGVEHVAGSMTLEVEGSELNRLNAEAQSGPYVLTDNDLFRCIRLALDYAKASGGSFDPTLRPLTRLYEKDAEPSDPAVAQALARVGWRDVVTEKEARAVRFRRAGMELDLGGIAHGYAIDVAKRNFALSGSRSGRIRIGHHAYAWRTPPGEEAWRERLSDPRNSSRSLGEVLIESRGIAISGPAESMAARSPVLDSRTGRPTSSNVILAVGVADSGADADAVSTALLAGGTRRAGQFLSETRRVEGILLVQEEGEPYLLVSASLRERFFPSAELESEVQGRIRYLLPPASLKRFEGL
jgi:thiamine biosynthesis lipoprotein